MRLSDIGNGPLRSGLHRFQATAIMTDLVGNTLDGDKNGTGGDPYAQTFTVNVSGEPTATFEGTANNIQAHTEGIKRATDALCEPRHATQGDRGFFSSASRNQYVTFRAWIGSRYIQMGNLGTNKAAGELVPRSNRFTGRSRPN